MVTVKVDIEKYVDLKTKFPDVTDIEKFKEIAYQVIIKNNFNEHNGTK